MSTFNELIDFTRSTTGTYLDSVVYGPELVTNGDFVTDSDWIKDSGWTISNGQAQCDGTDGAQFRTIDSPLTNGKTYYISYQITAYTSGDIRVLGQSFYGISSNSVSTVTGIFVATKPYLRFYSSAFNGSIDNVSVKEVIGGQVSGTPLLRTAAINEPRLEYDANGNPLGLLIEEARTNLVTYSNFDDSVWHKRGFAVNSTTAEGPYGTTAIQITENNTNSNPGLVYLPDLTDGTPKTFGVWLKASQNISIALATTGGLKTSTITVTPEWQFFWCTDSHDSSSGPHVGGFLTITRGSGITLWAAMPQMEAGSFPTSYIPTSGSTVTRAADVASLPVERFAYNKTQGSVVVQTTYTSPDAPTEVSAAFGLDDGTSNNRMWYYANKGQWIGSNSGSTTFNVGSVPYPTISVPHKASMAYKVNDFPLAIDGAFIGTATSSPVPVVNFLGVGKTSIGTYLNGHIKSLQYYPKRLSNEELELLTQPSASPTMNLTFDGQATSTLVEGLHD